MHTRPDPPRSSSDRPQPAELLQIMLEHTRDVIHVMDQEGRIRYISRSVERILGFTPEEMVGERANDFLHPDDQPFADQAFEDHIHRDSSTRRMEFRVRHRNGSWPVFEMHGRITRDGAGDPIAVVTMHEVTERKRLEQHRAQVLQFVGHDLRTPLAGILLHADLLAASLDARVREGPAGESLRAITLSAEQMESLIGDILDANRTDAGGLWLTQDLLSTGGLLRDALTLLEPLARQKSIRLEVDSALDLPLHADRERLLQVLTNLVSNALRFTPAGGRVALRATQRDQDALFSVTDTGQGISAEDLPRVFDRRWQAEPGKDGTMGLGLTISRGIVEAHRGTIWAESAPGAGSTFSFTIPLRP